MNNTTDQLIAGYTAYTDAQEIGASASAEAPATTPTIITASSPECGAFTVSVVSGAVGATANWGC